MVINIVLKEIPNHVQVWNKFINISREIEITLLNYLNGHNRYSLGSSLTFTCDKYL